MAVNIKVKHSDKPEEKKIKISISGYNRIR